MGSADQLAHADPALQVACPVCEALSHERCLERDPKQYVTPHAERAALITSTADRAANRLVVFSAPSPARTNLTAIGDADRAAAFAVASLHPLNDRESPFPKVLMPGRSVCRAGRSGSIESVDDSPDIEHRPGQPCSERDAVLAERFDARMRLPVIVSAILPLVVAPWLGRRRGGIATWLVFLVDYVVYG